jgi:hypothetical protein
MAAPLPVLGTLALLAASVGCAVSGPWLSKCKRWPCAAASRASRCSAPAS